MVGQASGDENGSQALDVYAPDVIVWDVSWETGTAMDNLRLLPEDAPSVLALVATGDQAAQARVVGTLGLMDHNASSEALAVPILALSHGFQVTDPVLWDSAVPAASGIGA